MSRPFEVVRSQPLTVVLLLAGIVLSPVGLVILEKWCFVAASACYLAGAVPRVRTVYSERHGHR